MDNQDKEFQLLLEEKRHKELISTLKDIAKSPTKDNSMGIENLLESIKQSNDKFPSAITAIGNAILAKLNEKKIHDCEIVERDRMGDIKRVIIKEV